MAGPWVFWPSCKVRLFLRFEDFLPQTPTAIRTSFPNPIIGPEIYVPNPSTVVTQDIVPYDLSYELNSYRDADSLRFTIPAKSLPLDPRCVRAGTIQVFCGTISAEDFAMAVGPTGIRTVVADFDQNGNPTEVFRGVLDELTLVLDGNDTLSGSARDCTSVLIDAEITENVLNNLNPDLPIDLAIQTFLIGDGLPVGKSIVPGLPGAAGLQVVNETGIIPLPTLRTVLGEHAFDSLKKLKKNRPGRGAKAKISYWDAITDIVVGAGFIVYLRLGPVLPPAAAAGVAGAPLVPTSRPPQLVISTPRTFYGSTANTRKFFYGGNVETLEIRRNMTGLVTPSCEVACYSESLGETVKAVYPVVPKANVAHAAGVDRIEVRRFNLKNVGFDPAKPAFAAILPLCAASIYEQLGRGEYEVRVKTDVLSILGAGSNDPNLEADMFTMVAGDPIIVGINVADPNLGKVSEFMLFDSLTADEQIRMLVTVLRIDVDFATRFVTALQDARLQKLFRVQNIQVHWNFEMGFEFEISSINFLDVREALLGVADVAAQAKADLENESLAAQAFAKILKTVGFG